MLHRYFLFFAFFILSTIAKAQPGWRDFTTRYYYTILDREGNEISFVKNKSYHIIIDSVQYRSPAIPNDSLRPVKPYQREGFDNYIRINDFSLRIPQGKYNSYVPLEIKIIHQRDTMYLNQTTGMGSGFSERLRINGQKDSEDTKPASDYTLQFIGGHYYFPNWAKTLWGNKPDFIGKVTLENFEQRHFCIPKTLYDSLALRKVDHTIRDRITKRADDCVVQNFIQGYFLLEKRIEPTRFHNSALPFKEPYWDDALNPTRDKDVFFGRIRYSKDSLNESNWKYVFSLYNKRENSIRHWFPVKDIHLFSSGYLYKNPFNGIIYQEVWHMDKQQTTQKGYIPPRRQVYQSDDEGQTWNESPEMTKTFVKHDLEHIEFLDTDFAVGYGRKEVQHKTRKYTINRVTYYLLKNGKAVDSIQMATDFYEAINYLERHNHSWFAVKDAMVLGTWNYNFSGYSKKTHFQIVLFKNQNDWQFRVEEIQDSRSPFFGSVKRNEDIFIGYHNFLLINKKELRFKNDSGTLRLKNQIADHPWNSGVFILENDYQIYLLDNTNGFTYFSFDRGRSWYIYPKPLEQRSEYQFLEIDDQGVISFFNPSKLYKAFYSLVPKPWWE
ncbi:hypothetical protein [Flavobacterium sp.]|uniref:hypothetical protein n=1 Tax=Flavobacterium sp. TaxID=239 RepID=UPI002637DB1B|nr:hypothetical protein [Flavobacterium sp.]